MNIGPYLPSLPQTVRETLAILVATIGAAYIISRFPAVREFVNANAVVIRDSNGETIRL